MRPVVEAPLADEFHIRLSPPVSSLRSATPPTPAKCNAQSCPWWPYSSSKEFKANTAMIVIILFSALICALAFNAAIRYLLRLRRRPLRSPQLTLGVEPQPKPPQCSTAAQVAGPPTLVFSSGMKLAGAEAECTVCLSEFVDGERIRVLGRCNHGFHVQCIQEWLSSHSSCPTCRASCLSPSPSPNNETGSCRQGYSAQSNFPPAATESQRGPELLLSTPL